MCVTPSRWELPISCILVGTLPSTSNAAGLHSSLVLGAGNWRVHSGFLLLFSPLATQGCFGAGRPGTGMFLVRMAGKACSPRRLQWALHCFSCHQGSLASKSTGYGCGFSHRTTEDRWQHPRYPSPWHSLGALRDQYRQPGPTAADPGTHHHAQILPAGWDSEASAWQKVGVILQSELMS